MHFTQGISFPRSGHGVVYNILKSYFGSKMKYCDPNNKTNRYCNCKKVPCVNPNTTFAKNHDFEVLNGQGLPIRENTRYFIQYRSPIQAIISNFYLYQKNTNNSGRYFWTQFAYDQLDYWIAFIDKWIFQLPNVNKMNQTCSYEELIADPFGTISKIIKFMSDEPLDINKIRKILNQIKVTLLNRHNDFIYYDEEFFFRLEEIAESRMKILGLPSFKSYH